MKTLCRTLKSKKQICDLASRDIRAAEFSTDGKAFIIEFALDDKTNKDLLIDFSTRTPRVYISDPYEIGV